MNTEGLVALNRKSTLKSHFLSVCFYMDALEVFLYFLTDIKTYIVLNFQNLFSPYLTVYKAANSRDYIYTSNLIVEAPNSKLIEDLNNNFS